MSSSFQSGVEPFSYVVSFDEVFADDGTYAAVPELSYPFSTIGTAMGASDRYFH